MQYATTVIAKGTLPVNPTVPIERTAIETIDLQARRTENQEPNTDIRPIQADLQHARESLCEMVDSTDVTVIPIQKIDQPRLIHDRGQRADPTPELHQNTKNPVEATRIVFDGLKGTSFWPFFCNGFIEPNVC